jgi:uncharacterized membrane protein (UPF0127 family)
MLKVKIADTPYALERGLMFVRDLPSDEGMLFVFPRPMKLSFWGKDTFIPLDIAFISRDHTIVKIAQIKPFNQNSVPSEVDCLFAIETNLGFFEAEKITVGSKVNFERYKDAVALGEVHFSTNIEGKLTESQNNKTEPAKQAQVEMVGNPPKIGKPGEQPIGDPIGQPPAEQEQPQDLPIISPSDLGQYLEDSFDEETLPTEEVQPSPNALETMPEEAVPEQVPQEPQEQPQEKEYPQFSNAFQALDWAEHNNEVVRIVYTSKKGRQITRDVEPHGTFHSEATHRQILVTFDETVGSIRAFIIHNISKWAFVGKQFNKKFVVRA